MKDYVVIKSLFVGVLVILWVCGEKLGGVKFYKEGGCI